MTEHVCSHGHCSKPAPQGPLCWGCWSNEQNHKPCTVFCPVCETPIPVVGEGDFIEHVKTTHPEKVLDLDDPRENHGMLLSMGLRHGSRDLDHYERSHGVDYGPREFID